MENGKTCGEKQVVGTRGNEYKYDAGKIMLDLVDPDAILELGKVLTYGAQKYAPHTWQLVDDAENRYYAAALRHLFAWKQGEVVDPESGCNHLSHVLANMMFLNYFTKNRVESNEQTGKI
jgi:hypothetical protein